MKGKNAQVGQFALAGIIAVIIGVVLITVFADIIDENQVIKTADPQVTATGFNQSFTLSPDDIVVGTMTVVNATCGPAATCTAINGTLRDGSEYTLNERTGVFVLVNRTGTFNLTYSYEPTNYIDSATGRVVARNITLLYAVGLILMIVAVVGINLSKK